MDRLPVLWGQPWKPYLRASSFNQALLPDPGNDVLLPILNIPCLGSRAGVMFFLNRSLTVGGLAELKVCNQMFSCPGTIGNIELLINIIDIELFNPLFIPKGKSVGHARCSHGHMFQPDVYKTIAKLNLFLKDFYLSNTKQY